MLFVSLVRLTVRIEFDNYNLTDLLGGPITYSLK